MELEKIRHDIDVIDDELLTLFLKRMEAVKSVVEFKKETGKAIEDRSREDEILSRLSEKSGDEFRSYMETLFSTILELSR